MQVDKMPDEELVDAVLPTRELDAEEKHHVNGADADESASDRESSEGQCDSECQQCVLS